MVRSIRLLAVVQLMVSISWVHAAEKRPPAPKVEILAPAAGATLSGPVSVQVRITASEGTLPTMAYAGFGGEPWVRMRPGGEQGHWQATLDSRMVPNGAQTLTIVAGERKAGGTVEVEVKNPLRCYFADLHSHTSYSDGTLLPSVAHQYAREVAKLDIFSLTDHLEKVDDAEWADIRDRAWDAHEDGRFVVIPGLEWTKKFGHACIYDPRVRVWPEDMAGFYQAAAEAGVIAKFNHPGTGARVFEGLAYSEAGDRAIELMEVRRPEEEEAFIRALNQGWHLAPDGSDDTHAPNWGNNRSWTGVWAPGLSYRAVWQALKDRHVYSTGDRNCQLLMTANGATMGDIVTEPAGEVAIQVEVKDADSDDATAKIELFEDGKIVASHAPGKAAFAWQTKRNIGAGKHYYFVKVTQADENLLWSAPVWFEN